MSIIASGTTTTNALVQTGNTDGTLQLQVNGTTPAVTLNTFGAVGVGSSPAYGTSGQVLTSGGSTSAPSWTTPTSAGSGGATASGSVTLTSASSGAQSITPSTWGQSVTLPNATTMTKAACLFNIRNAGGYPLKVVNAAGTSLGFIFPNKSAVIGLADNSTSAGVWTADSLEPMALTAENSATGLTTFNASYSLYLRLDADRCLFTFGYQGDNLYGVVFNQTTQTWGATTLLRSAASEHTTCLMSTDLVLLVSCANNSTALQAVTLSISGTTITVNTPASKTITAISTFTPDAASVYSNDALVLVGTTALCTYFTNVNTIKMLAFTVSGTTVTIGNEASLTGTSQTVKIYAVSSSVALTFSTTAATSVTVRPWTVSGVTLTGGTAATVTNGANIYRVLPITANNRWALLTYSSNLNCSIISVSGTTASASTVAAISSPYITTVIDACDMIVSGSKVIIGASNSSGFPAFNIVTDNSGTASAGTVASVPSLGVFSNSYAYTALFTTGSTAVFAVNKSGTYSQFNVDFSGSSPIATTVGTVGSTGLNYAYPPSFFGNKYPFTLFGTSYVYVAQRGGGLYQCATYSQYSNNASFPLQAATPEYYYYNGARNEFWNVVSNATGYTIQRIECATV